jgi:hypothetical protein
MHKNNVTEGTVPSTFGTIALQRVANLADSREKALGTTHPAAMLGITPVAEEPRVVQSLFGGRACSGILI